VWFREFGRMLARILMSIDEAKKEILEKEKTFVIF
jgi:hypothetical protein